MKKVTLFATIILALAMSASAQEMIDFTHLAPTATPQPVGEYKGLTWTAIDYVSVPLYEKWLLANGYDYADGFATGPEAQVAFGGGPLCYDKHGGNTSKNVCEATISAGIGPTALKSFRPDYMIVSEGWCDDGNQSIYVEAYNNGVKVGSQQFKLQANAKKFKLVLSDAWGDVSELRIHPSPGGSFVIYVLHLQ